MSSVDNGVKTPKNTHSFSVESIKQHSYRLALLAGIMFTSTSCASGGGSSESVTVTVAEELVNAMVTQESGGNQSAVSPDGAIGLVQIMPATGKQYCAGLNWQSDPEENKKCGGRVVTAYASQLNISLTTTITYDQCLLVLKAYNSGVGNAYRTAYNLDKWGRPTISNTGHARIVCNAVNKDVISNSTAINPVVVPKAPPAQPRQKQATYSQPPAQGGGFLETLCKENSGRWDTKNKKCL